MNTIFGSRNDLGSIGCAGEGDHKGSPLRKTVFCKGKRPKPVMCWFRVKNLHGRPRSEDAFHQVHA